MKPKTKKFVPGSVASNVIRAVIYCRVSSREQADEGFSLQAQLKLLRDYAALTGMIVVGEYVEIQSAKRSGRTKFVQMLKHVESFDGNLPVILVERTDRLTRNLSDLAALSENKHTIHFVKENWVYSPESTSAEKFNLGLRILMAKQTIDQLGEVVVKGMTEKAESGEYPSNAPVGYRNVLGKNGKRIIEPDPVYAPFVRALFTRYGQGGVSLRELTKWAADEGFVSPKTHKPFPRSSIQLILKRQLYCGKFLWDGEVHDGSHVPLVSLELWAQVQELLNGQGTCHEQPHKHEFTYGGFIRCGYTNTVFTGDIKKGGRYILYSPGRYEGPGKRPYVSEAALDQVFADVLKELQPTDETLAEVKVGLKEAHADQTTFIKERTARLSAERQKLKDRLSALWDKHLDNNEMMPKELFEEKAKSLTAEINRLSAELLRHEQASTMYYEDALRVLELAKGAYDLYLGETGPEKKKLLRFLCSNCTWKDGKLYVTLHEPFEELRVANMAAKSAGAASTTADGPRPEWLARLDSNQKKQNQNLLCYQLHHGPVARRVATGPCPARSRTGHAGTFPIDNAHSPSDNQDHESRHRQTRRQGPGLHTQARAHGSGTGF
ncbi:MAG: hypothetical protein BroJett014_04100 [Planctomycetota bacterium]|nr:MAG: hypothetical protein BroJett014_04100 [Planctomycetota bacterium]